MYINPGQATQIYKAIFFAEINIRCTREFKSPKNVLSHRYGAVGRKSKSFLFDDQSAGMSSSVDDGRVGESQLKGYITAIMGGEILVSFASKFLC